MSDHSAIQWTDATWNPTRGCSAVSPGCAHCYAERVATRFAGKGQPYDGLIELQTPKTSANPDPAASGTTHGETGRVRTGIKGRWNGQMRLVEEKLTEPLHWRRPRRIFVNSMSDLFHEHLTDEQIDRVFAVMALCPQHTFQVLTKRPERMRAYMVGERNYRVADVLGYYYGKSDLARALIGQNGTGSTNERRNKSRSGISVTVIYSALVGPCSIFPGLSCTESQRSTLARSTTRRCYKRKNSASRLSSN